MEQRRRYDSVVPDSEEAKHFSASDKAWIREWLDWTAQHKEFVKHTRSILQQPAIGNVDGTSTISGNHGYLFLFNPNYRSLPAAFLRLDATIGLAHDAYYLLREMYPQKGRILGKPGSGIWSHGGEVQTTLAGTKPATVLELGACVSCHAADCHECGIGDLPQPRRQADAWSTLTPRISLASQVRSRRLGFCCPQRLRFRG